VDREVRKASEWTFNNSNRSRGSGAAANRVRTLVRTPEIAARTITAVRQQGPELNERDVIAALNDFDAL
jgi:site-specific DNA recombinase